MLSSKQIEIFYQVYKNNSVTTAAQILSISQPSVSKTLKIIEKNIGYKLFLRKGKKLFQLMRLMHCLSMHQLLPIK